MSRDMEDGERFIVLFYTASLPSFKAIRASPFIVEDAHDVLRVRDSAE